MHHDYRLQWLKASDAHGVARLEAMVYPRAYRSGRADLQEQLEVAEKAGENLSIGLFRGRTLVGYCLMFIEPQRQKICDYLDIPQPEGLDLSGPGLYLADLAVHPAHRSQTWPMLARLAAVLDRRDDLRHLPLDALSTPELLRYWQSRRRVLAGLGYWLLNHVEFRDDGIPFPLHWVQFRAARAHRQSAAAPTPAPALKRCRQMATADGVMTIGLVDSEQAWSALAADWERLWAMTPQATVFSSFQFLRTWWALLGLNSRLHIVVALDDESRVRAIVPMQILHNVGRTPHRRCLSFIGQPSEVDRPTMLAAPQDMPISRLVADYLMEDHRTAWSSVILYEQESDSPLLGSMTDCLTKRGLLVETPAGPECPMVDVSDNWPRYLSTRSRAQRKSLKRHLARLQAAGTMALETVDTEAAEPEGLQRYLAVEKRSWKPIAGLGAARSSAHLGFLKALMSCPPPRPLLHFRFLRLNGEDIAATMGLFWNGTLYALHIVHDRQYDVLSPGFVLTALELENAFGRDDYRTIDYLGGFLSNKRGWATQYRESRALFAQPSTLPGYTYHYYHFRCKPWVKQRLAGMRLLDPVLRWKRMLGRREGWLA